VTEKEGKCRLKLESAGRSSLGNEGKKGKKEWATMVFGIEGISKIGQNGKKANEDSDEKPPGPNEARPRP